MNLSARTSGAGIACTILILLTGCGTSSPPAAAPSSSSSTTPATSSPASAAQVAFEAWSDRSEDYATWWARLKPLLSDGGQLAYAGTDPAAIPALHVTGPYKVDPSPPGEPGLTALVHVKTDVGPFGLFMSRQTPRSPWLLLQINFPAGIH